MPTDIQYISQQLPPWMEAMHKGNAENSQAISRERYLPYTQLRIAPFSKEQMEAHRIGRNTGIYQPYFNQAHESLQRSGEAFPDAYNRYKKPYEADIIKKLEMYGGRFLKEQIMPALEASFVGLGQHGSLQHRQMAERAARDVSENILAQQKAASNQSYNDLARIHESDRVRALQAGRGLQDLGKFNQASQLADIAALEHAGQQQQGQQQANLNMGYQDFLNQRSFPRSQLAEHMAAIQGLPHSQLTYQQNQFPNVLNYPTSGPNAGGQPNMLSNIGNLAGQLYGLGGLNHKEGGSIKKAPPSLGGNSLMTSSFIRHPKVGGKNSILKRKV